MKAWNIKQLKASLDASLLSCHTKHEIMMCDAIGGKEIVEKAIELAKIRKLTPAEMAIAEEFGCREGCV